MTQSLRPRTEVLLDLVDIEKRFTTTSGLLGRLLGQRTVFTALDRVSLSVMKGEVIGLVGESGSGKSTLALVALRLLDSDGGSIAWKGHEVTTARGPALSQFRRQVQMVFQDSGSSLNPRKTIGRHLAQSLALAGLPRAQRSDRAVALLALVGLHGDLLARYPHQLSGGQRQRVGIARSLAKSPELLVADEPVASLDVSMQAQIVNLLSDLRAKLGLTLLFISHDLALVARISTRVAVMYAGAIVEEGDPATVLHNPAHPYTRALLAAIPRGIAAHGARRFGITDAVPARDVAYAGCRFAPRCPDVQTLCRTRAPPRIAVSPAHHARCHFPLRAMASGWEPQRGGAAVHSVHVAERDH